MTDSKFHDEQEKLAMQEFEKYKTYIAKKMAEHCQESFMTVEKMGENWQKTFDCTPKYVEFLKASTKSFLYTFPTDNLNYCAPDFFKKLVSEICFYIIPYVRRMDKIHETDLTDRDIFWYKVLFTELFTANHFIKGQIERYNKKRAYQDKIDQAAEQIVAADTKKRVRKRIGEKIDVTEFAIPETTNLNQKRLNQKIAEIRNAQKQPRTK